MVSRFVKPVAYDFIGIHKRKALFHGELLEESFDIPVTAGTTLRRRF